MSMMNTQDRRRHSIQAAGADTSLQEVDVPQATGKNHKLVKACTSCRQQKLRCDARVDYSTLAPDAPEWAYLARFLPSSSESRRARTRYQAYKGPSKADMQRELDLLRKPSSTSPSEPFNDGLTGTGTIATDGQAGMSNLSSNFPTNQSPRPAAHLPEPLSMSTPTHFDAASVLVPNTTPRSLESIFVDSYKIDDCFSLFFSHYHPMLPILDHSCSPDTCYKTSPLVFWCVLITGARRYDVDPTLLDRLAPSVATLALKALLQTTSFFSNMCGLLMLCVWPLPMRTILDDPSPMYAGATMQLALQHGLHMMFEKPEGRADFAHQASLARVWVYLEFACHCMSWSSGIPSHCLTDVFDLEAQASDIAKLLPPSLYWMQKFDKVVARAHAVLSDLVLRDSANTTLSSMIKVFIDQVLELSHHALEDIQSSRSRSDEVTSPDPKYLPNPLIVKVVHFNLHAYHFFERETSLQLSALVETYDLACQWTDQASEYDRTTDWALYSSEPYFRLISLVAAVILRISHSAQLRSRLDLRRGERAYFAAIKLLKRRSLQSWDVNSRIANMFSQLWHNNLCFKRSDGTNDSLHVRHRARGTFAIVWDCFAAWQRSTGGEIHNTQIVDSTSEVLSQDFDRAGINYTGLDLSLLNEDDILNQASSEVCLDFLHDGIQWPNEDLFWS